MTTLKSALRFPPAHPPPPPPPPEAQYPNLTSRFSAETLLIKSPSRAFQRLFSSATNASTSPPPSPPAGSVKRYRRRVSSQKGIYRHAPSASESRLVVSSPKAYDLPETPTRASMDDVRPTRRSGSISRARAMSGTAADKLAGAAKEVLEKFTLRRHGRQGSHSSTASGESIESLASPRRSRSLSSPSPVPPKAEHAQPSAPARRPPPRPYNPPAATLVNPPPRSDSRNAMAADLLSRATPLPALAATRPRLKQLPLAARPHLRPTSPPSPSIPPLRPARPPPPPPAGNTCKRFQALAIKSPSRDAVRLREPAELLVRIDVGGQSTYTTSYETLVGENADAGRLGEFVEAEFARIKRLSDDDGCHSSESTAGAPHRKDTSISSHPYLQLPHVGDDVSAASSSLSLAPSFAPSPYPSSPFPFADDVSTYSGGFAGDEDPMSPIDPLVNSATAALVAKNLILAFPPAFTLPPHPLPSQAQAQKAQLVGSPTLPHGGKHCSVYPDVGSSVDLGPEGPAPLPFVVASPASVPPVPSLAEEAARKALAMRLRRASASKRDSSASSADADEPLQLDGAFERGLGPYFDVVRNQLHASTGDSLLSPRWPTDASSASSSPITAAMSRPAAVERQSLDFGLPADIDGYGSEEEHRSRSTVLGVPRGWSRRTLEGLPGMQREEVVPSVPALAVQGEREVRSRTGTPSLSMSVTTVDEDEVADSAPVSLEDATLVLFLDRSDPPLLALSSVPDATSTIAPGLSLYSAILAFLRSGSLPAVLVLPHSGSAPTAAARHAAPDVDPLYLSLFALTPAPLFALLAALRTLADEAAWLGMAALERACADELVRVGAVVRWLAEAKEGSTGVRKKMGVKMGAGGRDREGWI